MNLVDINILEREVSEVESVFQGLVEGKEGYPVGYVWCQSCGVQLSAGALPYHINRMDGSDAELK